MRTGRRLVVTLTAAVSAATTLAFASSAIASPLRELAASTVAFSSDGVRFVAWQTKGDEQIVVLDTLTDDKRQITPPVGCRLQNEAETGEPGITAAAGRFLLTCAEGGAQALLDVRTGTSIVLPVSATWFVVGTRYVQGVENSACSSRLNCQTLYDLATGAVSFRPESQAVDLDRPGASTNTICPAVRRLVVHNPWKLWNKGYAFQGNLFAQRSGTHGNVQIDHCQGRPTILNARGGPVFGQGEPLHFDLRGGLLSWDTGSEAGQYIPEEPKFRGSLYTYELTTHGRRRWLLPRLTVNEAGESVRGTFGYSTHTSSMVFWIAARSVGGHPVVSVESSTVYAGRV